MFVLKLEEVYYIRRKDFTDPRYFLKEFDVEDPLLQTIKWTPTIITAKEFITEEAVETFKYQFLRDRPCEIVRITN